MLSRTELRFHLIGYRPTGTRYCGGGEYEHLWDSEFVLERDLTAEKATVRAAQLMSWDTEQRTHDYETYTLFILPSIADQIEPDEDSPLIPHEDACQEILALARKRAEVVVEKRAEDRRLLDEQNAQRKKLVEEAKERAELQRLAAKYPGGR